MNKKIENMTIREMKELLKDKDKFKEIEKDKQVMIKARILEDDIFKNPHRKLKRVESKKEYWRKHKEYKKQISRLFRKAYKFLTEPDVFIEVYENLLARAEFEGIFSKEWVEQQKLRLYKKLNKPEEFKEWIQKSKKKLKKKGYEIKDNAMEKVKSFSKSKLEELKSD